MRNAGKLRGEASGGLFINERTMCTVSIVSAVCGVLSIGWMTMSGTLTLMALFERSVKLIVTLLALWSFFRYRWDMMKGLLGGLLFSILYQEADLVLGRLWGETADFDTYLIMGVEGSLFLAAQTMSLMMTVIITANHYIIEYSPNRNERNLIFNKISILFKITLYLSLMAIDFFLDVPLSAQVNAVLQYAADLCMVMMLVCIEAQLESFNRLREDVRLEKRRKEVRS